MKDAIVRLVLEYPREWEALIDETALREYTSEAFEFHLIKRPLVEARSRLAPNEAVSSLTPLELLDRYWRSSHVTPADQTRLQKLAEEIMQEPEDLSRPDRTAGQV